MICQWYKDNGYHFLALSDHNIIADEERWINVAKSRGGEIAFGKYLERFGAKWVEQRPDPSGAREVRLKMLSEYRSLTEEPGCFLLIRSEEISDRYLTAPIHLNATNLSALIKPQGGASIVEVMPRISRPPTIAPQWSRLAAPLPMPAKHSRRHAPL